MSRGPVTSSAHTSQDFHLLELAPSPRGGVAGVSTGQSLHPSGCGSYVAAEYSAAAGSFPASLRPPCSLGCRASVALGVPFATRATMDERPSEMSDAEPPEAEAAQGRPRRSLGRAHA